MDFFNFFYVSCACSSLVLHSFQTWETKSTILREEIIMIKKYLHRVFIDGLSGMAMGLFATLIVGTIIQQIGTLIGGQIGDLIFLVGKVAAAATCAGIGVGVAHKFQESSLVVLSAATCGMIGGYASTLLAGTVFSDGSIILAGPGEPLGAFIAAYVGIEVGHLIAGKTKINL